MKKKKTWIAGIIAVLIIFLISFFLCLTPVNLHAPSFWSTLFLATLAFAFCSVIGGETVEKRIETKHKNGAVTYSVVKVPAPGNQKLLLIPAGIVAAAFILAVSGAKLFHAGAYSAVIDLQDAEFSEDMAEALGTDSIALMDTASAKMLGDREIGSLSSVVSQYDVSDEYTQIDLKGKPMKVAALDYAGFFKWINNNKNGVPGYVTVNPVSMSANYVASEDGMIYVPSAYLGQDAGRYIRMHYPTVMFGNLHFEIDEDGKPYYVASVYQKTISLFGGTTVNGCIVLDPVTGDLQKYSMDEVPTWVDVVMDGDLICEHYNWYGQLKNGFINSIFGKKGCKQVTRYTSGTDDEDDAPVSDYGYVAKDGDIWIYTGVTSVNGDSSNIGFLLANERTGEAHYYNIAGADEKSAMAAAEGEVQEKRYQASFPSLINVDGNPTYIMVLKDASGLVKLYAAVNVEQYNLVTTASTQAECMRRYRELLGIEEELPSKEPVETEKKEGLTVVDLKFADIDGNTYIYLLCDDGALYRAKAGEHEEMLFLEKGTVVTLEVSGKEIVSCETESVPETGTETKAEEAVTEEEPVTEEEAETAAGNN